MNETVAKETRPDPRRIMELSTAYWGAQTLLTANRLGVFGLLAGRELHAPAVAAALGTAERSTALLLRACAGLGLLEQGHEGYRNSPMSETFLVPGKPSCLGDALRYSDDLYTTWGQLEQSLKSGRPALQAESYLGRDPEQTRHFVRGMHNRALAIGRALVDIVDLGGRSRMLDIGGGPGTYSALFAQRNVGLRSTVMDLPDVVAIAGEILSELGVADRVTTLAGDYKEAEFPGGNDVILISGVFHRETEGRCRELIASARVALADGGLLVISDVFTDETGVHPPFAALFGLNMMLTAEDGGVHSDAAVASWMAEAGFSGVRREVFPPPMPHRVVSGVRS
jgi:SAM-dependent methyltransferase